MRKLAGCLTAFLLAACAAETPGLNVLLADEVAPGESPPATDWMVEADFAGDARSFFFAQTDLYLAGASPADDSKLADVLRAMGRDDLVMPGGEPEADWSCPRPWVDPIEMIARAAEESRIIIIESERNTAAQTAFAEAIVGRLAADGFTAYADDGLTLGPGGAGHPDVLLVSEGMVTRDPSHGRLLREVKRNRLQLVDAGVWWTSPDELAELSAAGLAAKRQEALANQVRRRVFANDPAARVIFHTERSEDASASALLKDDVARLTEQTPLLVVLAACSPSSADPAYVPPMGEGEMPFTDADLVFAIPQAATLQGRQTSGRGAGEQAVAVPAGLLASNKPLLVEARRTGDPDLAVPEDRLMLFPGDTLPLLLPSGTYKIEAWTKDGRVADAVTVAVP